MERTDDDDMADIVNLQTACGLLNKGPNTLKGWFKQGCPVVQRGNQHAEWQIAIGDVLSWREEQAVINGIGDTSTADADELKKRKLAAETTLVEIEVAKAKGEVAYIDDVAKELFARTLAAKTRMRNVATRVVSQIIGETNESKIKDIITDEIDYALSELSNRFIDVDNDIEEEA